MAECVSCGKETPAGKFFCEDCYVKMKGRRGPSGELLRPPREEPRKPAAVDDIPRSDATTPEVAEAEGLVPLKKASGTLTPASSKKVISMKPGAEKAAREKTGKKRIKVTITFSERTYAALARVKGGRKEVAGTSPDGTALASRAYQPGTKGAVRGGRLHRRPKLKAVAATSAATKQKSGFRRAIGYRDRALDGRDKIAIAMAIITVLAIVILCFMPWAKVSWSTGGGTGVQTVEVTGTDLGAMTYVCMAIVISALLYAVATWVFKGMFTVIDFGVIFIVAGIVFIPLLYSTLASNARFLSAALEQAGISGGALPAQFERQTLWPAYALVLAGAILGFAGLIRLSERKVVESKEASG